MAAKTFGRSALVGLFLILMLSMVPSWAQPGDGDPELSRAAAAKEFPRLLTQWTELDRKLTTVGKEFRASVDPDQRDILRQQYSDFVQQAKDFLPRLRVAAVAAYELAPNDDPDVTRTVLGLMANDVHGDDYDAAEFLARLLVENKCEEKALFGLVGVTTYCLHDFVTAEKYLIKANEV